MTNTKVVKSGEKLSSGYRINRAADDAAGLSISEKMRRQIRGLYQGADNIMDGVSMCQIADGALHEAQDILQRANELAVKASNDTLTSDDRSYIDSEFTELKKEINRIGSTTTFNEQHILSNEPGQEGGITGAVTAPSAGTGKMAEAYQGNDGKYYMAASLDFAGINPDNLEKLDGGYFSFVCHQGCGETFKITFTTDPSQPSSATGLSANTHEYLINIAGAKNGTEVSDRLYNLVKDNLPNSASGSEAQSLTANVGGVGVSHATALVRDGSKFYIVSNYGYATEEQAKNEYKSLIGSNRGDVDCSGLAAVLGDDTDKKYWIHCSSDSSDGLYIYSKIMNTQTIGIEGSDMKTSESARKSIDSIKGALHWVSKLRSDFGAQQNRLEHTYNNNLNVAENTTAAESQIRDTDMAKEMVALSNNNILAQAGQSMLSSANQTPQAVLSLLQ